ncbi:hypothetical protein ACVB8X_23175 [Streptomyces sp. NRAIS4]
MLLYQHAVGVGDGDGLGGLHVAAEVAGEDLALVADAAPDLLWRAVDGELHELEDLRRRGVEVIDEREVPLCCGGTGSSRRCGRGFALEATFVKGSGAKAKPSTTASRMAGASSESTLRRRWLARVSALAWLMYSTKMAIRPMVKRASLASFTGMLSSQAPAALSLAQWARDNRAMPPTVSRVARSASLVLLGS